ncbi:MAG: dolichyl-phosphate-mannose-protein mannosyltransferase [Isosphaeraceae bacterium]
MLAPHLEPARRGTWQLSTSAADRSFRRWLFLIVLAGVLARGLMILKGGIGPAVPPDDPDRYLPLARSVAAGEGFLIDGRPTAYRPPLYPLTLAPIVALMGDRVAIGVAAWHLLLGTATVLATARAARGWGLGPARALAAAAVVAFDPVLLAQARPVMTETLAAFLTAATLAALTRPGATGLILGGFFFGLSALCRPSAWPALGLTLAAILFVGEGSIGSRARRAALLLLLAIVTASPWAFRNVVVFGEPVWTTTHGGYTLYLANNPVYFAEVLDGPPEAIWTGHNQWLWFDSVNREARGLSEPDADRLMRRKAVEFIESHPRDFARASLARLARFWGVAPSESVYPRRLRAAVAAWTLPLWACLLAGLFSPTSWRWPRVAAPAIVLGLTAVHAVYWTDMRMRATVVPAAALVAAAARSPGKAEGPGLT